MNRINQVVAWPGCLLNEPTKAVGELLSRPEQLAKPEQLVKMEYALKRSKRLIPRYERLHQNGRGACLHDLNDRTKAIARLAFATRTIDENEIKHQFLNLKKNFHTFIPFQALRIDKISADQRIFKLII